MAGGGTGSRRTRGFERAGIALDVAFLQEMSRSLQGALQQLEEAIYQAAGHSFNANSTQQLSQVLFQELGYGGLPPGRGRSP